MLCLPNVFNLVYSSRKVCFCLCSSALVAFRTKCCLAHSSITINIFFSFVSLSLWVATVKAFCMLALCAIKSILLTYLKRILMLFTFLHLFVFSSSPLLGIVFCVVIYWMLKFTILNKFVIETNDIFLCVNSCFFCR